MDPPSFFTRTLFCDLNPAVSSLYQRRSKDIFIEDGSASSFIEARSWPGSQGSESPESSRSSSAASDRCHEVLDDLKPEVSRPSTIFLADEDSLLKWTERTKCANRIFFIRQRHSWSYLTLTQDLFEFLLVVCEVFPKFKEFVLSFGRKSGENEIGHPQLKFRPLSDGVNTGIKKSFECAYGIRFVEFTNRGDGKEPWSIRQTAVYHKYYTNRPSTWILIGASRTLEERLDQYYGTACTDAGVGALEPHLVILDTALANWRPYMVWLTEETNEQINKYVVASVDGTGEVPVKADFEERQRLKIIEDHVLDIFVVFDSFLDTISSLIEKQQAYEGDEACQTIIFALVEKQREVTLGRQKVEALHKKVQGTIRVLSSLLDLGNGHALRELAEEAKRENQAMRMLTQKGTQDAAAVKVLTVITLIYLPASAVASFFSTQFVIQQQKDDGSGGYRLTAAANIWLFFVIAVPLTALTVGIWVFWVRLQHNEDRRIFEESDTKRVESETEKSIADRSIREQPWKKRASTLRLLSLNMLQSRSKEPFGP